MFTVYKIILTVLLLTYNVIQSFAMPTKCQALSMNNNARLEILDRITNKAMPLAMDLKNITGLRIVHFKANLDRQPPYTGFPKISSKECSVCRIDTCFSNDCNSLETLIQFINKELSPEFSVSINRITYEIDRIRERMDCQKANITADLNLQSKEKDYRITKDIVNLLKTLENKYKQYN